MSTSQEAPAKKSAWDSLPPEVKAERLAKMKAGRKPKVQENEAEALKRRIKELEALLKTQPQPRSAPATITADPGRTWRYEFTRTNRGGVEKITTLDDPLWKELANFNRDVFGTFIVEGDPLGPVCLNRGPRPALEMAQRFVLTGNHVQPLNDREVKS